MNNEFYEDLKFGKKESRLIPFRCMIIYSHKSHIIIHTYFPCSEQFRTDLFGK